MMAARKRSPVKPIYKILDNRGRCCLHSPLGVALVSDVVFGRFRIRSLQQPGSSSDGNALIIQWSIVAQVWMPLTSSYSPEISEEQLLYARSCLGWMSLSAKPRCARPYRLFALSPSPFPPPPPQIHPALSHFIYSHPLLILWVGALVRIVICAAARILTSSSFSLPNSRHPYTTSPRASSSNKIDIGVQGSLILFAIRYALKN
ncbi:hypothetical protein BS47DRAFT_105346 [Hydnum rufescens UP504]|uniref:Uncharacterized protein n=1 Tax=Hydnum rufescens UP504 TaxID=1448309 RepID=A0A9P6AQI8_9AGAM|nr:hypothetical protein BS47DRAFT_105346 [Hydnum rufescens UP504]